MPSQSVSFSPTSTRKTNGLLQNTSRRLGIPISCSHEVLPEYREYARFSTTVANAYIRPTLERHLSTLTDSDLLYSLKETVACNEMEGVFARFFDPNTKNIKKQTADTYPEEKSKKSFRLMLSNGGCVSIEAFFSEACKLKTCCPRGVCWVSARFFRVPQVVFSVRIRSPKLLATTRLSHLIWVALQQT